MNTEPTSVSGLGVYPSAVPYVAPPLSGGQGQFTPQAMPSTQSAAPRVAPEPIEEPKASVMEVLAPPAAKPVAPPALKSTQSDISVTQEQMNEMKSQINDSFSEVVGLICDLQRDNEMLHERIAKYNERSSHKI